MDPSIFSVIYNLCAMNFNEIEGPLKLSCGQTIPTRPEFYCLKTPLSVFNESLNSMLLSMLRLDLKGWEGEGYV